MISIAEKTVMENADLLRHIYSFGTPSHRKFTNHLMYDLKPYPELLRERYYSETRLETEHVSCSIKDYLYNYSVSRLVRYLRNFNRCYCCSRHSIDNPRWIHDQIVRMGPYVFENQDSDCDCCCRSLSRQIVRNMEERATLYPEI